MAYLRITAVLAVLMGAQTLCDRLAAQDFEDWKEDQERMFQEFRDERDKAFMEMLQEAWEFIDTEGYEQALDEPKVTDIPEPDSDRSEQELPDEGVSRVQLDRSPIPESEPEPEPTEDPSPEADPELADFRTMNTEFYHTGTEIPVDPDLADADLPGGGYDEEAIGEFWQIAGTARYEPTIDALLNQKSRLGLNDWGFAKLTWKTGLDIFDGSRDHANLFTWFVLTKTGYMTRIGHNEEQIYLLLATESRVYGANYFDLGGVRYYALSFDDVPPETGQLYTYTKDYPDTDRKISLTVEQLPAIENEPLERTLEFQYAGNDYEISVQVDQNLIRYYEFYPQTDLEVYFNAPVTRQTAEELLTQLEPIVEDMPETHAVNLILRFVQTAFGYKIDPDNFGREKPLFPEETLFYDYSDCEDRAILFSYLVRNLLGMEVIGLRYPGHIATAVRFQSDIEGDAVNYEGERFLISDPTFVNADIGMEMPAFADVDPEPIPIKP